MQSKLVTMALLTLLVIGNGCATIKEQISGMTVDEAADIVEVSVYLGTYSCIHGKVVDVRTFQMLYKAMVELRSIDPDNILATILQIDNLIVKESLSGAVGVYRLSWQDVMVQGKDPYINCKIIYDAFVRGLKKGIDDENRPAHRRISYER